MPRHSLAVKLVYSYTSVCILILYTVAYLCTNKGILNTVVDHFCQVLIVSTNDAKLSCVLNGVGLKIPLNGLKGMNWWERTSSPLLDGPYSKQVGLCV